MAKRNRGFFVENSFFYLTSLLIYSSYGSVATGFAATLSPTPVAPVCRVGDPLELTCSATENYILWNFIVGNEQGVSQEYSRTITSQDASQQVSMLLVNSTTFTFMRTSSQGSLPLVSTLVIDSVNRYLNGTEVHCLELQTAIAASTTIHLFENNPSEIGPIAVTSEEEFGADNVTVTVEWTQEEGVTYQIIIIPELIPKTFTGESSIQLILPYNISYSLSVEACGYQAQSHVLLFYANCGHPLLSADNESKLNVTYSGLPIEGATISFTCRTDLVLNGNNTATCMGNGEWEPNPQEVACIEVADCGHPMINEHVGVVNYDESDLPTEQGTTINLTCPSAMSFTGQNSITCMENGEWEPDPTGILCQKANCGHPMINKLIRVVDYDENDLPTKQGTTINLTCPSAMSFTGQRSITCMENGEWEPDPTSILCQEGNNILTPAERNAVIAAVSSITVCALSSLVFFVIGYACGHKHRHGNQNGTCVRIQPDMTPQVSQPNPMILYEEILPESNPKSTNQFELEDNVAYDPQK